METKHCAATDLSAWIETNGDEFIAHAIWPSNASLALNDGLICPAESILSRPPYKVEYEKGSLFGARGITDLSDEIKSVDPNVKLPYRFERKNAIPLSLMVYYKLLTEKDCVLLKANFPKNTSVQLKNGKSYAVTYSEEEDCVIENIPLLVPTYIGIQPTYYQSILIQEIINSHFFDRELAEIWNSYSSLIDKKEDLANTAAMLMESRQQQFLSSKLNADIRCVFNGIAWGYGDLVILRGKPHEVISATTNLKRDKKDCYQYKYGPLQGRQEVQLLLPFENKGEYFSLDLEQEDTIIIGPEALLAPFRHKRFQMYAFEEMSPSQLDFFQVPDKLRPKLERSIESELIEMQVKATIINLSNTDDVIEVPPQEITNRADINPFPPQNIDLVLQAGEDNTPQDQLLRIIAILKANISTQQHGRQTTRNSEWKVNLLIGVEKQISEDSLNANSRDYIDEIRAICAMKRNSFHFWSEPHSVAEFEILLQQHEFRLPQSQL